MPEMLDIVDENGLPTGRAVPRTVAHAEGLRHRTSHVWIVRKKERRSAGAFADALRRQGFLPRLL